MDFPIHFILCDFGQHGRAFLETDPEKASREQVVQDILDGQIDSDVLSIMEVNLAEGWARDVTEDVAHEIYDRCIRKAAEPAAGAIALMDRFHLSVGAAA